MQGESSDISLDSVASTTASDVLIHSTSVHRTGSLSRETPGGSRRFKEADFSQELLDLLDIGMVAARGEESSLSGVYSGRREHTQKDSSKVPIRKDEGMKMRVSPGSVRHSGLEHKQGDSSKSFAEKESSDREEKMTSLGSAYHSGLLQRNPSAEKQSAHRGMKMTASSGSVHYKGPNHRQRDSAKPCTEKESADRGIKMRVSPGSVHHSGLEHRAYNLSHSTTSRSGQVIMDVPDTMAGEGSEILHMSEVSKGVLQASLRKLKHGEAIYSQDTDGSTVHISVKRLREIPAPLPDFTAKKKDPTYIPPALPANKYPAVRFTLMEGTSDADSGLSVQKNVTPKNSKSPKAIVTKHFQDNSDKNETQKKSLEGIQQKDGEVKISQFTTGQKESLLAALNKRVQSGPVSKEVRVQLLDDPATSSKKSPADEKTNSHEVQSATIAAATAAAIAATAPVLKAQSGLEAQVNSVSQLLNKLQEADRQLQKLTEQQIKIQNQPPERLYHQERVSELEKQLSQLTEQRLQHLEKLQQQQLEMQSHFIRSTIKTSANPPEPVSVCTHIPTAVPKPQIFHQTSTVAPLPLPAVVPPVKETGDSGKSPLETPAPRRFAPQPISMDLQPPPKAVTGKENIEDSKNHTNAGKGHFLQQILRNDGTPLSNSSYRTHNPLNLSNVDSRPFNDSFLRSDGVTKRTNVTSSTAVQKPDNVLEDLNMLKQEIQNLMKNAKQWKSQAEDWKPKVSSITSAPVVASHSFRRSAMNPPKSMFEDAEHILREVQNNKKIIDDNLEAIIRAKDDAAFYSLIDALTTNGNGAEKIRIQKTVDSWIREITSEIQDELAREDIKKKKPEDRVQEPSLRRNAGSIKDVKNNRDREIKGPVKSVPRSTKPSSGVSAKVQPKLSAEKLTGQQSRSSLKQEGKSKVPQKVDESSLMDEDTLDRVYGTPIYRGHRSTLKKGPYLRFRSPSPKSKPRRPKIIEIVKGVKLKSTKIQTDSHETEIPVIKAKALEFSVAKDYGPQYVFIPSSEPSASSVPMVGHLIPTAIPLGMPRFDRAAPLPSAVIRTRPQPVTVNVSVPPQSPKVQPKVVKPNVAVVKVKTEKKEPPQLSVQVLPCVDIDSIVSDSPSTSQRTPSPEFVPPTPSPVQPDIQLPVKVETEEEILAMPGTSYQAPDFAEDEEVDEVPEPLLELNGWGEMNVPQHGGIPFPPPIAPPQTSSDILDGIISRRETVENKLISWVEQEIMARIISEMHPVRRDIIPDVSISSTDHSEAASDIVEAAGGKGLQLFVDAGVPVDSNLLRKYVEEALAEIIAPMLEVRKTQAVPIPSLEQSNVQPEPEEVVPVPTPQSTPPASPLPSAREPSIVKSPSIVQTPQQKSIEEPEVQQEELDDPGERSLPVHVCTQTITPVPSPPRVSSPTPVISEKIENPPVIQEPPPNPWGNMELPLEEENPHSAVESVEYKDAAVMTVAVEEEPRSLISAASSEQSFPMSPKQRTPSPIPPVPSPSVSAPSTDESSLTVTVTESDTTDKPISEGEIVYSYGQIAAARALAEGGFVYPHLTESLSSTLRDTNDMEFDPPSEGQVIQGPHRGAHHDPVLSLLAKFNQDLVAPHEALYHLESSGEDSSLGEISEGQRPRLTMAAEQVLVGHSVLMGRPSNVAQTAGRPQNRPSSPGQYTNIPGVNRDDPDNISSGPMSIGDLDARLLPVYYPHADNQYQIPSVPRDTSQGPGQPQKEHQPVPTRLIQVGVKSAEDLHQGDASRPTKNIPVTLPTMSEADEEVKMSFVESDSSGADSF
ncbi:protein TALPID3 [Pyxicephalus adspersus]|uniref:protein TALPID3 n=1 Tax=Pyxicephalus adspersus TaxID=30357 RepID=UPI003B594904